MKQRTRPGPRGPFKWRTLSALALGALTVAGSAVAQEPEQETPAEAEWPAADPGDVASIDDIIAALYEVISGPAGQPRDWDRFRSLHTPEARLMPTGADETGDVGYRIWSVNDYIEEAGDFLEQRGFFEREIGRVTERFKSIAHVFSTYDSRWTEEDPEPFQRGINSIQLFHDGERWWIMNIFWRGVPAEEEIPERYLQPGAI